MPSLRWALLAASALFNVVLFVRRPSPASKHAAADAPAFELSGVASSGVPRVADSETYRHANRSSTECQKELVLLESEISALSMELRRRLPMPRLFALGEPNSDAEQMFRPLIERIFAKVLAAEPATSARTPIPYTLECQDIICQLTFIAKDIAPAVVGTALSTDGELRRRVTALSFPQSRSTEDVLTKTRVNEAKVYWRIVEGDGGLPRP
jgi:hypothetical protein